MTKIYAGSSLSHQVSTTKLRNEYGIMETIRDGYSGFNDEYYVALSNASGREVAYKDLESLYIELAMEGRLEYHSIWRSEKQEIEYFLGKYDDSENVVKISFINFEYDSSDKTLTE